jgi:putative heme-binding domain-containing protein
MRLWITAAVLGALLVLTTAAAQAGEREPWTSSRIQGTPDPPLAWTTERVFPSLSFREPVDAAYLPGTDWMFVMELAGKVFAFDSSAADPQPLQVFDAREVFEAHNHSYGLTFHPDVAENRYVYICWTVPGTIVEDGTTVSRFELSHQDPPRIRPETRTDIIQWPSGGHNGGCLKFGPDGMLYISTGDGVGPFPPDSEDTGQDLSDLRSTILRIDVDRTSPEKAYTVPADNPFMDHPGARPEVWAYGFRNPWKMAFSPSTGDLLVGDVGWELWEMIYRVVKGGNYGWSVMEGRQPVRSDIERGPTPIRPPLVDHDHVEAKSITGGFVYRGPRLPELQGAYIYGDWSTGKIWGLRHEEDIVTWHEELADTSLAIITFGENRHGELFIVDYAGSIHRLVPNPRFGETSDFPLRLSETGLFRDVSTQAPAAGVIPYSLIAEPWLQGAQARRFVALPKETSISGGRNRVGWSYPAGAVFVRTLFIPPRRNPRNDRDDVFARNIETQILHYDGQQWRPYTYLWNEEQTDAALAPAEGAQTELNLDGQTWTWRIHSRTECSTCHNQQAGFTLGFFPQNLRTPASTAGDQLAELIESGIFADAFSERDLVPPVCDPYAPRNDLQTRARSYLMVNCAHCHRREAGGNAAIEFPIEKPLEATNAIDTAPTQGTFGIPHARIIAPADPSRSVLYYRMATVGPGHMPHLGVRRVDEAGLRLIHDWIAQLPRAADAVGGAEQLQQRLRDETAAVDDLSSHNGGRADVDSQGEPSIEDLLWSTTGALKLVAALDGRSIPPEVHRQIVDAGAGHENIVVRGLFERFLPEQQRTMRLGTTVDPVQILALEGDAARGRELFASAGVQCRSCHQVGQTGKLVGPALDDIGRRMSREQILESILEPSRKIDAPWVAHTLVTADGRVLTGVIRDRSAERVVLRDAQGIDHMIPVEDIEELVAQQKSLMPELLVQDLTADQLADLLAWLESLQATPAARAQP